MFNKRYDFHESAGDGFVKDREIVIGGKAWTAGDVATPGSLGWWLESTVRKYGGAQS